ncbi:prepilin-type N-terminal cleavage/methylation domain-containing protein [Persephonella sp.]
MVRKIKNGFSLVELLIVIVLVLILVTIAVIPFKNKMEANRIETDIRRMYGLLQEGRMIAFVEKRKLLFKLNPSSKTACLIDANSSITIKCVNLNKSFYPSVSISIDKRGTFTNGSIYYTGDSKNAVVDCISISYIRVKMGVWNGSDCVVK